MEWFWVKSLVESVGFEEAKLKLSLLSKSQLGYFESKFTSHFVYSCLT